MRKPSLNSTACERAGTDSERSFRMTKSDLAARRAFHRLEDSIRAHLTIVFAALAVSREAQTSTGLSIKRVLKVLQPCAQPLPPSAPSS